MFAPVMEAPWSRLLTSLIRLHPVIRVGSDFWVLYDFLEIRRRLAACDYVVISWSVIKCLIKPNPDSEHPWHLPGFCLLVLCVCMGLPVVTLSANWCNFFHLRWHLVSCRPEQRSPLSRYLKGRYVNVLLHYITDMFQCWFCWEVLWICSVRLTMSCNLH